MAPGLWKVSSRKFYHICSPVTQSLEQIVRFSFPTNETPAISCHGAFTRQNFVEHHPQCHHHCFCLHYHHNHHASSLWYLMPQGIWAKLSSWNSSTGRNRPFRVPLGNRHNITIIDHCITINDWIFILVSCTQEYERTSQRPLLRTFFSIWWADKISIFGHNTHFFWH